MLGDGESPTDWADCEDWEDGCDLTPALDPVLAELWDNENDAEYDRL